MAQISEEYHYTPETYFVSIGLFINVRYMTTSVAGTAAELLGCGTAVKFS